MIWYKVKNKWLDKWTKQIVEFSNELDTAASLTSPLSNEDRREIVKIIDKLHEINERIYKRRKIH